MTIVRLKNMEVRGNPTADLIQYVPYGNPIYYIDPNPAPTPEYPDIKVIKATATEGMKQLIQKL